MIIRNLEEKDREIVIEMMRKFYTSPAVHTNGSEKIFADDVDNCINENPYIEGFVFENDSELMGYGMIAKSFSTEFGKRCIWIEDIYIKEEFRGQGIGGEFLELIIKNNPDAVIRLEAEEENERAVHVYKKHGFEFLPYLEMIKR